MEKEAKARIKINKLLEESGWRFFDNEQGTANIELEPGVVFESLGDDLENAETHDKRKGAIDFLLLDTDRRPLVVVEAKRESIDPLSAKEQARTYARNVDARFVILSNGNIHYFWDTKFGNPETISRFPTQDSITQFRTYIPNPAELADTVVDENYIVASQMPGYADDPSFKEEEGRDQFLRDHNLKQMRPYQVQAIHALQSSAREGKTRFLFEMATGTGKTLTSAGLIKLFLKSGNARRVLFLVDRLELEEQSYKAFRDYLGKDYQVVIYKDNREAVHSAQVVISTIQTFLSGDRYRKEFSPTDFELVISDEAHRSIGGNSRAVFEYFVGYKLGLTATPKDYLRGFEHEGVDTQREFERRQLFDTYKTFGCEPGQPTFRYDLVAGVGDEYLVNPTLVDARTAITTQLLSEQGLAIHKVTDDGETIDEVFSNRHYEKAFFNDETNIAMCKALLDHGVLDPIAKANGVELFGKTIVFCVSQKHAAKITNILNRLALERWPQEYGQSDFAIQITSQVANAQQMTINFANNRLSGRVMRPEGYDSGKTRVAVTVGMMTTGYDCQDLLNIALMRPVFSPADFVQIKGRGTRKFTFNYESEDENFSIDKVGFKFFDFFATCEYFEQKYPYQEKLLLPRVRRVTTGTNVPVDDPQGGGEYVDESGNKIFKGPFNLQSPDEIVSATETFVGEGGMRIDREGFKRAVEEDVLANEILSNLWKNGDLEGAEQYTRRNIFERPKYFLTLEKIRRIFNLDRRVTTREFLEVAFGQKKGFETRDELLESEWKKFLEVNDVDQEHYIVVKTFFKAFITDDLVREIIESRETARFNTESSFHFDEYAQLNGYKTVVPQYVKDYVSLNVYMS
ncbi:MAG TPA: DEAD/DEAH box helicase family protein [Candidatus Paceibacterota bacterium]|nr:DEAD/DEAH box helicase family protein [Candidatus Paceibacterota bacterium]